LSEPYAEGLSLLRDADTIFITSHVNPDGDAVGSLLALGHAMTDAGKRVTMALQDPVPDSCRFLPRSGEIVHPPITGSFDLAVVVDCEGPHRAGTLHQVVQQCPKALVIDHHLSDTRFGTAEIRETTAAATGEILTEFIEAGGFPITQAIADCLMAAIVLDTGGLRYPNTTGRTLRCAARLRDLGADLPFIYREQFENRTFSSVKLLGIALERLRLHPPGEIVYTHLTREDFDRTGAGDNDTDGINVQLMSVNGVEASAFFREGPNGDVRVSLRSRGRVDCNAVARTFGGGGHRQASGCSLKTPLHESIPLVLAEMEKSLA
jgi:bifunctional oligoribonuclease and PAP phosphatase NrnA